MSSNSPAFITLEEIEIPECYRGRVTCFNDWRWALAEMTGVAVRYVVVGKTIALDTRDPAVRAPEWLPVIEAQADAPLDEAITPQQRLGDWELMPADPLLVVLLLTVPGGIVRHRFAGAMAARLAEMTELMYGIDDGRYGLINLGRFTEQMTAGFRRLAEKRIDAPVAGGYEPRGWWDIAGQFTA
ncbi:hypothetical protein [Pseudorhodoplanes sp.]|uniref:hypothetical protein n=1 Tax=Pseudorhodoplanes sp. TaxID=1934341 RepID=UPI00391A4CC3